MAAQQELIKILQQHPAECGVGWGVGCKQDIPEEADGLYGIYELCWGRTQQMDFIFYANTHVPIKRQLTVSYLLNGNQLPFYLK